MLLLYVYIYGPSGLIINTSIIRNMVTILDSLSIEILRKLG